MTLDSPAKNLSLTSSPNSKQPPFRALSRRKVSQKILFVVRLSIVSSNTDSRQDEVVHRPLRRLRQVSDPYPPLCLSPQTLIADLFSRLPEYPATCYTLHIQGFEGVYGHLIEDTINSMTWNDSWVVNHDELTVTLRGDTRESRQEGIDKTLLFERDKGTFKVLKKWTGERFPIYGPGRELIVDLERSGATLFGIVTYGVQLITYVEDSEGRISVWLARRAPTKTLYPDRLGVTVGGSLPARETPFECLIRESQEEASLPADLVRKHAKSAGTIAFVTATESKTTSGGESGLIRAETQFVYDMKVDESVIPTPFDMEASDISLYSVDEIKKALDDGEFTPGNACLILDFFIRHGLVTYENEENYTKIVSRLHRSLGQVTM